MCSTLGRMNNKFQFELRTEKCLNSSFDIPFIKWAKTSKQANSQDALDLLESCYFVCYNQMI